MESLRAIQIAMRSCHRDQLLSALEHLPISDLKTLFSKLSDEQLAEIVGAENSFKIRSHWSDVSEKADEKYWDEFVEWVKQEFPHVMWFNGPHGYACVRLADGSNPRRYVRPEYSLANEDGSLNTTNLFMNRWHVAYTFTLSNGKPINSLNSFWRQEVLYATNPHWLSRQRDSFKRFMIDDYWSKGEIGPIRYKDIRDLFRRI